MGPNRIGLPPDLAGFSDKDSSFRAVTKYVGSKKFWNRTSGCDYRRHECTRQDRAHDANAGPWTRAWSYTLLYTILSWGQNGTIILYNMVCPIWEDKSTVYSAKYVFLSYIKTRM